MQAFTLDLESKNPKNKRKPSHNKTACLLCQAQRRKWLPAGTSVIPKCNKKQKTQPDEPSIRAVKVIICAFTASPNLFEVCLSNRHCTNPLVHQGQQLAVQRCSCLCWDPSVFPRPAWKWYLQETKDWASAVCWSRSFMRTVRVLPSVQVEGQNQVCSPHRKSCDPPALPLLCLFLCLFLSEGQLELLLRYYVNTASASHAIKVSWKKVQKVPWPCEVLQRRRILAVQYHHSLPQLCLWGQHYISPFVITKKCWNSNFK